MSLLIKLNACPMCGTPEPEYLPPIRGKIFGCGTYIRYQKITQGIACQKICDLEARKASDSMPLLCLSDIIAAIDSEPELPGEMPFEMRVTIEYAMEKKDIDFIAEAMRIIVQETKHGIRERVKGLCLV